MAVPQLAVPRNAPNTDPLLSRAAGGGYYFTLESKLRVVEPDKLIRRPGGMRVSVVYDAGAINPAVRTRTDISHAPNWRGLSGAIVSGADFLLFRLDGVLELDGRITMRATDGTLIDATYKGLVDLYEARERQEILDRRDRPRHVVRPALN